MLYAATHNSLTKALGATAFSDSMYATSKEDLTASAYAKHRSSLAAPKPMSAREKEMEEIKQAELLATANGSGYQGSGARLSHIGSVVGLKWSDEVTAAVEQLFTAEAGASKAVIIVSYACINLRW